MHLRDAPYALCLSTPLQFGEMGQLIMYR